MFKSGKFSCALSEPPSALDEARQQHLVARADRLRILVHRAGERFEVSAIKAVRPTLVKTLAALKKGDIAQARAAFEAYDSGWNGIEMYINTRDKSMYDELEKNLQERITKGLASANPDVAALTSDAQTMLAYVESGERALSVM